MENTCHLSSWVMTHGDDTVGLYKNRMMPHGILLVVK